MSNLSHVAIIDPAVRTAELECFNQLVRLSPVPLTYHLPALFGMASLKAEEPAAIVILGSSSSVHDGLPWQEHFSQWLKPRLLAGTPTLGICYGHQLVAHLMGGTVGYLFDDKRKLQGFRTLRLENSRLWGKKTREGEVFASHRETVTACPPDFSVVGTSAATPTDALEHARFPIYTFQSHPESTPGFLTNVGAPLEKDPSRFAFGHALIKEFLSTLTG